MKQESLFASQEAAADKARRDEYEKLYGWTPERAKNYDPGHPWCAVDAYPTTKELFAAPPHFGPKEKPTDFIGLHSWPTAQTPKAKEKRLQLFKSAHLELAGALTRYDKARTEGAHGCSEYDLKHSYNGKPDEALRNALASYFNHVSYAKSVLAAAIARWPELADVEFVFPETGNGTSAP
jgi:hypothetical protein